MYTSSPGTLPLVARRLTSGAPELLVDRRHLDRPSGAPIRSEQGEPGHHGELVRHLLESAAGPKDPVVPAGPGSAWGQRRPPEERFCRPSDPSSR
jgi:hypothetical protein